MKDDDILPDEQLSRQKELAFFGKISASVSHEINNVITSIKEISGLLADLAEVSIEMGRPLDVRKIKEKSDTLLKQTDRGVKIIKRFNRFAHSVDEPVVNYDLKAQLANLLELGQRLVTIRNVTLEGELPAEALMVTGYPFGVQHAVFACIEAGLSGLEKEGRIALTLSPLDNGAQIRLCLEPVREPEIFEALKPALSRITAELKAECLLGESIPGGTVEIVISLPKTVIVLNP